MAYQSSLKLWAIPVWTRWKCRPIGKTARFCVGAITSLKRDFLTPSGSSHLNFHQRKMDASKIAGEGQSGEDAAVSLFREYLRIKTVHPDPDYGKVSKYMHVAFTRGQLYKNTNPHVMWLMPSCPSH